MPSVCGHSNDVQGHLIFNECVEEVTPSLLSKLSELTGWTGLLEARFTSEAVPRPLLEDPS